MPVRQIYPAHPALAALPLPLWVRLVRDADAREKFEDGATCVETAADVVRLVRPRLAGEEVEVMVVVPLDAANRALGVHEVARGGVHGCAVTAREIFRAAVALGAAGVVLAHNHPSGSTEPSGPDDVMTATVRDAGAVIGIALVDHVIVAGRRSYSYLGAQPHLIEVQR